MRPAITLSGVPSSCADTGSQAPDRDQAIGVTQLIHGVRCGLWFGFGARVGLRQALAHGVHFVASSPISSRCTKDKGPLKSP